MSLNIGTAALGFIIPISIIGIIWVTVLVRKEYTYSISLNHDTSEAIFTTKSLTNTIVDIVSFNEIFFTYKKRTDYYKPAGSYRRKKKNILLIDSKKKTLAFLVPEQDGWTDKLIYNLAKEMFDSGVKQKVEKYNDNEIKL